MDQIQNVRKAVEAAGAIWVGAQVSTTGERDTIIFLSPASRTEISLPVYLSENIDFDRVTDLARQLVKAVDDKPQPSEYVRVKRAQLMVLSLSVLQIQQQLDKLLGR